MVAVELNQILNAIRYQSWQPGGTEMKTYLRRWPVSFLTGIVDGSYIAAGSAALIIRV